LALAFEFRGEREGFLFLPARLTNERDLRFAAVYTLVLSLAIVAGEATALFVLAGHEPSSVTKWFVGTALTTGGLGVLIPIVLMQLIVLAPEASRVRPKKLASNFFKVALGLLALGVVGATIFALVWIKARASSEASDEAAAALRQFLLTHGEDLPLDDVNHSAAEASLARLSVGAGTLAEGRRRASLSRHARARRFLAAGLGRTVPRTGEACAGSAGGCRARGPSPF
jgi:hypothetical protein